MSIPCRKRHAETGSLRFQKNNDFNLWSYEKKTSALGRLIRVQFIMSCSTRSELSREIAIHCDLKFYQIPTGKMMVVRVEVRQVEFVSRRL
ncbi:hypothetical protein NPIL_287151 [Nephila pilipes]|uniref:Uncharacterized protein n=1 Tax=Nephila pilipes TaxID=299642 RepID=A0A8X6UR25_NEPPI|nr:hypothetical protein NPIL_287151 [Nephila pilipes]